jgi:hypothetical protein
VKEEYKERLQGLENFIFTIKKRFFDWKTYIWVILKGNPLQFFLIKIVITFVAPFKVLKPWVKAKTKRAASTAKMPECEEIYKEG